MWRQTYGKGPLKEEERKPAAGTWATLSHWQQGFFCYTSRGTLAGTRNISMDPPWGIDPTTHRTMSDRSYHGATYRFVNVTKAVIGAYMWQWWLVQILWHLHYAFSSFCCLVNYYTVTFATCWYIGWVSILKLIFCVKLYVTVCFLGPFVNGEVPHCMQV